VVGDGFIFVDRDFPTPEKKLFKSSHCCLAFWVFKKLIILLRFVFYCNYFIDFKKNLTVKKKQLKLYWREGRKEVAFILVCWVLWVVIFYADISCIFAGLNLAHAWSHSLFQDRLLSDWFEDNLLGGVNKQSLQHNNNNRLLCKQRTEWSFKRWIRISYIKDKEQIVL